MPMRPHRLRRLAALLLLLPPALHAQDPTLDRARRAIESGQSATVKGELAAYVRQHPRSAPAAILLGRVHLAAGDPGTAADWFEKAAELDPRSAQAEFYKGAAYGEQAMRASKLRQPFLAKKVQGAFERAVQLDPDYLDARDGLVDFYRMAPGFMGGGIDKARAQAVEIRRRDALRGAYAFAEIAIAEKRWDVAAQEYERAIVAAPDSVAPYLYLGELQGRQGKWELAWTTLERYRVRRPADPRLPYFTGRLAATSGLRLDEGEQALRAYLAYAPKPNEPTHATAHWRLGQIRERRADKAGARAAYETALRLDPDQRQAKDALKKLGS